MKKLATTAVMGAALTVAFMGGVVSTSESAPAQVGSRLPVGVVMREFKFEPRPLRVKAGNVRFLLMNRGVVEHDFAIPSLAAHDDHEQHVVKPGKNVTLELNLKPGRYEAICTVPGHKEAGMVVAVEVSK